jgi:putative membrane protein
MPRRRRIAHIDRAFSPRDLLAIESAVREVEARSPGQVVPFAVDHSDGYDEARWTLATLGSLVGGLAAAIHAAIPALHIGKAFWIVALPAAGAAIGYLLAALLPGLRRHFVSPHTVEHRVHQRAVAAFLEQEVFKTGARTGILVFLSLRERRVVILADTGISARVEQHEWNGIAAEVVTGMRRGEPGPTLATAIRRCGQLLVAHNLGVSTSVAELSNELRRRSE